MNKKRYLIIFVLTGLISFALSLSSTAELDKTRKMKAEAQYHFEKGEYYKAIDIWAEVLKIDSYDKEALDGIQKTQKIIEETRGEKEKTKRQRLRELIRKGKNYYRDREYKKALSSWGQALSVDPTNKEVLDLIEEARIRAEYQISILDKLDKEKRLKTPHVGDLDKIANRMINLLEKVDVKMKKKKKEEIKEVTEEEAVAKVEEEKEFIETTFARGEGFYKEGRFKEAISEWNKILPYLPKSSEISVKIAELKERVAEEERKRLEEIKGREKEERRRLEEERRQKELEQRKKEEQRKFEEERIRKKEKIREEKGEIREEKEVIKEKFPRRQDLFIIGTIFLLVLLIIVKISFRTKTKSPQAKAPPKKGGKEEFEPRDLKRFLKKKPEDKDKDLFK